MRTLAKIALVALAVPALATPALAFTATARVAGGDATVRSGPGDDYRYVGRIANGTEIPVTECTQNDRESRHGSAFLRGAYEANWCLVPDLGWVDRGMIVGRGLVNVTPPDFLGAGW